MRLVTSSLHTTVHLEKECSVTFPIFEKRHFFPGFFWSFLEVDCVVKSLRQIWWKSPQNWHFYMKKFKFGVSMQVVPSHWCNTSMLSWGNFDLFHWLIPAQHPTVSWIQPNCEFAYLKFQKIQRIPLLSSKKYKSTTTNMNEKYTTYMIQTNFSSIFRYTDFFSQ